MQSKRFVRLLWLIVASCDDSSCRRQQNPIELFNGHDLAGWTYHLDKPDVKMEDVWSVKDGVLRCKGKPAGYLLTKKNDYRELRADSSSGAGRRRAATTGCLCM